MRAGNERVCSQGSETRLLHSQELLFSQATALGGPLPGGSPETTRCLTNYVPGNGEERMGAASPPDPGPAIP